MITNLGIILAAFLGPSVLQLSSNDRQQLMLFIRWFTGYQKRLLTDY